MNKCASHVTAVILTKNEESNVTDCLKSVEWVAEIIVVDSESTDRTVELAQRLTSRVYVVPWRGFGPQKNFGIEHANGPWILIVDADERVTVGLRDEIQDLLQNGPALHVAGYRIARRNFFYGRWMQHGGMFPDRQLRFFRKDAGRYDDTLLHERLLLKGEVKDLQGFLDHHSVPTMAHHVRKMIHYTSLARPGKIKNPSSGYVHASLWASPLDHLQGLHPSTGVEGWAAWIDRCDVFGFSHLCEVREGVFDSGNVTIRRQWGARCGSDVTLRRVSITNASSRKKADRNADSEATFFGKRETI